MAKKTIKARTAPGAAAGAAVGTYSGAVAGGTAGSAGCTVAAPGIGTIGCGMYGAGVGSAVGATVGACIGGYLWETYFSPSSMIGGNKGVEINGRYYTGHALDRMEEWGLFPSVVEETIKVGISIPSRDGTIKYETDDATVIVNSEGDVATAYKR
jgi:filamentous hemagglutinin